MIDPNIDTLELVVHQLEELAEDLLFVGGATVGLYITDRAVPKVRFTIDIDCVVEVVSRGEYYAMVEKLKTKGFREDSASGVICRFKKGEMVLDLMPTHEDILNFTNRWYLDGIKNREQRALRNGKIISILSAPFFVATKIEAFKGRGKGDYMASHDIEDIVTIFDGDSLLPEKIVASPQAVRDYLKAEIRMLLENEDFTSSIEGHISDRLNTSKRTTIVLDRLRSSVR